MFDLRSELVPNLADAYQKYEDRAGPVEPFARNANVVNIGPVLNFDNREAAALMSNECGLPFDLAYRFCLKCEIAGWRCGLFVPHGDCTDLPDDLIQ